jgi:hydroxymethylbilane synthase
MTRLRLGSRGSALAMWQAHHIAAALADLPDAPAVEIIEIKTTGDAQADTPLWKTAGKGFFTAELDRALADNTIDLAVHSLKDLPTKMVPGLALAAVPEREDPRDALVCRSGIDPDALPRGAIIGTSSLRRRAFVARWRQGITHQELRGNVPTRVRKLDAGQYDAIVLAVAGLKRLGLASRIDRALPIADFTPAVSQGALGITTREDDAATRRIVAQLEHAPSRIAVNAERALLHRLEGGCQIPLGANARMEGKALILTAQVCTIDGSTCITAEEHGDAAAPEILGEKVAALLIQRGARDVLASSPRLAAEG